MTKENNSEDAKEAMRQYVMKKGALAFGVAVIEALERIAPEGYGPKALLPRAKSVICLGVGGGTKGAWAANAKTLSYIGDTETMGYRIAYGLAFMIEKKFSARSIFCPPDMNNIAL